jgi:hypothetical protein
VNRAWHIVTSAIATFFLWFYSNDLNINTVAPVLVLLTPIVALAGAIFPDLDQSTSFLNHRSFLTHSAIIGITFFIPFFYPDPASFLINIFCFNVGIHLIFDLKRPSKMRGFANVTLPSGKEKKAKTTKHIPKSKISIAWLLFHGILLIGISIIFL